MSNFINVNDKKHGKDCADWCPMEDGTKTGDPKYCALSLLCRQIGMKTDWITFLDESNGMNFDYFCTGMFVREEDKGKDDEVS